MSKLDEIELPSGWAWATLESLLSVESRSITDGPFGSNLKSAHYTSNGARVLRLQNVGDGVFRDERAYVSLEHFETLRNHEAKEGDLIVASLGEILPRVAIVPKFDGPAIVKADVIRARIHETVSTKWVLYALLSPFVRRYTASRIKGVGRPRLGLGEIRKLPIPVPPSAEQHRIVDVLEGHLSRLDAAASSLGNAQLRAKLLRKSSVEMAMNGGFNTRDNEDESISILLQQVENEISQVSQNNRRKTAEQVALSPYVSPPSHWSIRPLGSLARRIEYGTSAKAHADPADGDIPVLRMGNIQDGRLDMQNLKYLPFGHPDTQKLSLCDGDLLFNRTNSAELVGKSAVYHSSFGPATFASYLIRCQLASGVEPEWVSMCINSPEGRRYINSVAAQQVGQANVNGTKLSSFPIPLPPHKEQLRLLAELREWNDKVERTSKASQRTLERAAYLRESLLSHAFNGRLVPQDPADEPASALLDRIHTEREVKRDGSTSTRAARKPRKRVASTDAPSASSTTVSTFAVQQELPL